MEVIQEDMDAKRLNKDILFDRNEQRRMIHVLDQV